MGMYKVKAYIFKDMLKWEGLFMRKSKAMKDRRIKLKIVKNKTFLDFSLPVFDLS